MINKGDMFMIIEDALNEIDIIPNTKTDRYYNEDGDPVPRVTEILSSMMHSDALLYWANSLGFKHIKYSTAINQASIIGTKAHNSIENYLMDKATIEDLQNVSLLAFISWRDLLISKGITFEVISMEERIVCKWFGGTYDILARIGGRIFLIDLKTSNHITEKYFMQLAAYKYMLMLKGINIDGVIILQLSKEEEEFNEYALDFSIPGHFIFMENCTRAFLSLVYAYYNVRRVQQQFKDIF